MILDKKILRLAKKILFIVSLSFAFIQVSPQIVYAAPEVNFDYGRGPIELAISNHPDNPRVQGVAEQNQASSSLPDNQELAYYETYITATAYTSREAETDGSPYIAAWGDHVFWGMIASNAFPYGTKIQIPDYFGDKMFIVLDRMNARYYHRLDVWMPELPTAQSWGARYLKIKVYK
ncbi:hypothetical protein COU24_00890 [Candidatus Kuenenbacteria bacterium CG10_big_fil_rev_8_21_14_0_10_39_14]|uniref:3D domain-containing protein n=4 Tax=Candidatus Kueneniibacteriota TaxID=1752740 RepID=A0A2H0CZY4_9BACT|nr:hypothetical protein [Candidatus Kuenenbacteria bacterium]PIP75452.1 MAG: hypothetical protein COW86_03720 [Candidatus Kuenenbacteria bacterium CG22_combo_CG10-13_8_21_14_all_39_9]PIR81015.1 MAG: hypothetical protein COU24_00890 [Candidatus Kuenenbacteria bacterium CG10_big_fil_rev_8_21_14_0_10_39_14]